MKTRQWYWLLPLAGILACGDDPVEVESALTMTEVEAMYFGIQEFAHDTLPAIISFNPADSSAIVACPLGGQSGLVFEFQEVRTDDDFILSLSGGVTLAPTDCRLRHGNHEFTITATPDIETSFHFEFSVTDDVPTVRYEGAASGSFDWRLEDRSGTCNIALVVNTTDPAPAHEPITTTISGIMCGLNVSFTHEPLVTPGGITGPVPNG